MVMEVVRRHFRPEIPTTGSTRSSSSSAGTRPDDSIVRSKCAGSESSSKGSNGHKCGKSGPALAGRRDTTRCNGARPLKRVIQKDLIDRPSRASFWAGDFADGSRSRSSRKRRLEYRKAPCTEALAPRLGAILASAIDRRSHTRPPDLSGEDRLADRWRVFETDVVCQPPASTDPDRLANTNPGFPRVSGLGH